MQTVEFVILSVFYFIEMWNDAQQGTVYKEKLVCPHERGHLLLQGLRRRRRSEDDACSWLETVSGGKVFLLPCQLLVID